ncbi:MAG TPA: AAA family ATPase [Acetobacteraceae bacterium]
MAPPSSDEPRPPGSYVDLYGLARPPFDEASSPGGFMLLDSQRPVLEALVSAILNGQDHILLTGERGIGKTTLLAAAIPLATGTDRSIIPIRRTESGLISLDAMLGQIPPAPVESAASETQAASVPAQRVLLIDDAQDLAPDALRYLCRFASGEHHTEFPSRLLLAATPEIWPTLRHPECRSLAARIAVNLQLNRLSALEVHRYIEHRLWVAGGSVRRLLTPPALRDVIRRSEGSPGRINMLMEAILNAGFVRGEPVITPRTIQNAVGDFTPREPQPRREQKSEDRTIGLFSVLIFLAGAGAFTYTALNHEPAPAPKPAPAQAVAPASPQAVAQASRPLGAEPPSAPPAPARQEAPPAATRLSPDVIQALMKRGDSMLATGDIIAARLLYQRAAEAGNAQAATATGKTLDAHFLTGTAATGIAADPTLAAGWYRRAIALGDHSAEQWLKRLPASPDDQPAASDRAQAAGAVVKPPAVPSGRSPAPAANR